MKTLNPTIFAISIVLVAGASFFAGTKYQQTKITAGFQGRNGMTQQSNRLGQTQAIGQNGNTRTTGNRMQGGPNQNMGEITSIDEKSITIKLNDGSSKMIVLSDKTTITKEADASKSDLKVGESVAVFGITNTDGSVTATSVNLNPAFRNQVSPTPTPSK